MIPHLLHKNYFIFYRTPMQLKPEALGKETLQFRSISLIFKNSVISYKCIRNSFTCGTFITILHLQKFHKRSYGSSFLFNIVYNLLGRLICFKDALQLQTGDGLLNLFWCIIKLRIYYTINYTISRTLKGKTQLSTLIKFFKVMAVPLLMYGSENWSLNRSDKRKIEAAEMRFLRLMAGYTLLDKKRSSDIREQLVIFNNNVKWMQYKINWREHI